MKTAIAWLPSVLWMALIFVMSAMPGEASGAQSGALLEYLLALLHALLSEHAQRLSPDLLHLLIRKSAHMAEYAVLALLNLRALLKTGKTGAKRPMRCAFLLAAAYAATDEFHQSFVAGRWPSPADVLIDAAGAALALLAAGLFFRLRKSRSN